MKVVIFANGQLPRQEEALRHALKAELIIAVDGGARHCSDLNLLPHILLGDLDTISSPLLQKYEKKDVKIIRYPTDKDKTDLELALDFALEQHAATVTVFGALGPRWDMSIGNMLLLAAPDYSNLNIKLIDGDTHILLLREGVAHLLSANPGSTISLIPLSGSAEGVSLTGFKYPLTDQQISHSSTLGISNMILGSEGKIYLRKGLLLCIVDQS